MELRECKASLEAMLFAYGEPLSAARMAQALEYGVHHLFPVQRLIQGASYFNILEYRQFLHVDHQTVAHLVVFGNHADVFPGCIGIEEVCGNIGHGNVAVLKSEDLVADRRVVNVMSSSLVTVVVLIGLK